MVHDDDDLFSGITADQADDQVKRRGSMDRLEVIFLLAPHLLGHTRGSTNGVDEDIVVVTSDLPHRESFHYRPKLISLGLYGKGRMVRTAKSLDELALGGVGLCVVVRDHDFGGSVVNVRLTHTKSKDSFKRHRKKESTYRLAAVIISVPNPIRHLSLISQEPIIHHPPELEDPTGALKNPTSIERLQAVPLITRRLIRPVERRVRSELRAVALHVCVGRVHSRRAPVRRNTKHQFLNREPGIDPGLYGTYGGALLVLWRSAGLVKSGVGTDGGGPAAPEVVVHESEVVVDLCKGGHVIGGLVRGVVEWEDGGGGGDDEVGSGWVGTELLEEFEVVLGIVGVQEVAAETLFVGVFPTVGRERWLSQ